MGAGGSMLLAQANIVGVEPRVLSGARTNVYTNAMEKELP